MHTLYGERLTREASYINITGQIATIPLRDIFVDLTTRRVIRTDGCPDMRVNITAKGMYEAEADVTECADGGLHPRTIRTNANRHRKRNTPQSRTTDLRQKCHVNQVCLRLASLRQGFHRQTCSQCRKQSTPNPRSTLCPSPPRSNCIHLQKQRNSTALYVEGKKGGRILLTKTSPQSTSLLPPPRCSLTTSHHILIQQKWNDYRPGLIERITIIMADILFITAATKSPRSSIQITSMRDAPKFRLTHLL